MSEAISSRLVAPWLPESALLLVVGMSVGPKEWEQQRPFAPIAPVGGQLRTWLVLVGLDPDTEVAYTNVVMEYKPAAPNYEPTEEEILDSSERIGAEIEVLPNLKAVVLLGKSASHLYFNGSMGKMHGLQSDAGPQPFFACYHPSFYLRGATHAEAKIVSVLKRAALLCRGGQGVELPEGEMVKEVEIV